MMRVIQGGYLDVSRLPSQKQSKQQQNSLVGIQHPQPDNNVVNLACVQVGYVKYVVIFVIVLQMFI